MNKHNLKKKTKVKKHIYTIKYAFSHVHAPTHIFFYQVTSVIIGIKVIFS